MELQDGRHVGITTRGDGIQSSSSPPSQNLTKYHRQRRHDWSYYSKCLTGGVLSSSIRWVLTPLDAIKCEMQVHPTKYRNFVCGLKVTYRQLGVSGLYRGLVPTVLAYSTQTGTKYALYEYIKDQLTSTSRSGGNDNHHNPSCHYGRDTWKTTMICLISAGCAEAVADVLMCPWETLKVQMQTSSPYQSTSRLRPAMLLLFQHPQLMFASIGPLWGRQILGTMANFVTFETTVKAIYRDILKRNKEEYSSSSQLAITFFAGYVSGVVSTIVSHPADSLISLKATYPEKSFVEIYRQVGLKHLATQGLGPRMALTGSIIGFQWFIYDTCKTTMGLGTSGGY